MSVDTYLEGKHTGGRYSRFREGDVEILVANSLTGWAETVQLDVRRFLFWKRLKPRVLHKHRPT